MPGLFPWMFPDKAETVHFLTDVPAATNCSNGVQWIWTILHDCVVDTRGEVSDVFGIVSIILWIVVGTPQMVMNCRNIRGIEGISIFLILQWTLGDTTNLIGSVLTNQLPLQIYLAVYFVFADLILFSQYLYYRYWIWKRKQNSQNVQGPSQLVLCLAGVILSFNAVNFIVNRSQRLPSNSIQIPHHSRQLLATNLTHAQFFRNLTDETGYFIGVISSIFYIGSRTAQIVLNYKRKSVEGLSLFMFLLAVLGNITYGVSILVRSVEVPFILHHLPWLIGSLGVVFLDLTILLQFRWYKVRDFDTLAKEPLMEDQTADGDVDFLDTIVVDQSFSINN